MSIWVHFAIWASYFIFGYFLVVQGQYLILLLTSFPTLIKRFAEIRAGHLENILKSNTSPHFSFIIPAYNMEICMTTVLNNVLNLAYKNKDIIVINDGSKDKTMDLLMRAYKLVPTTPPKPPHFETAKVRGYYRSAIYPKLIVIDKENGGKADAMNAGLNFCMTPYYLQLDSDTLVEDNAILSLIRFSLVKPNAVACGATIGIGNDIVLERDRVKEVHFPKKPIVAIQTVEYTRAFLFSRLGWNRWGGNLSLSGAFGFYNREVIESCGGYKLNLTDDIDMTVRLHRALREKGKKYVVDFLPDVVAWTEVPSDWLSLYRQRDRWQRGVNIVVWRNRKMLFNPRYGRIGMASFPALTLIEALSPLIETFGYLLFTVLLFFKMIDFQYTFWFVFLAVLFPMMLSVICIMMDLLSTKLYSPTKSYLRMFFYAILEQLGYRQTIVIVRVISIFKSIMGVEGWVDVERKGLK